MAVTLGSTLKTKGLLPAGEGVRLGGGEARQRDVHTPSYELIIRPGQGAQPFLVSDQVKANIAEVVYEDNSEQFDRLTITINNQLDNGGGGDVLSIVDSKIFAEGHRVEVQMGFGNSLFTVGACIIVKKTPDFPSDDSPSLEIECLDILYLAARSRPKGGANYVDVRYSRMASIIGARNGFDIKVSDPRSFAGIRKTKDIVTKNQPLGMSDYEFLKKIADINGFDLYSKFNPELEKFSLFFQPGSLAKQREVFTFVYNAGDVSYKNSLLSFTPTLDAYDQSTDFEIYLIDNNKTPQGPSTQFNKQFNNKEQKELIALQNQRIGKKSFEPPPFNPDGIQVGFKAYGRSFKFPKHKRFREVQDAVRAIENFIKRQKENFVTGSGLLRGNEVIQSRQVHNLLGIGGQFSGKYYFTQVKHKMSNDEGYFTEFKCRKVIEDVIVQTSPTFNLTPNDKRVSKVKLTQDGRSSVISGGSGE